jgi:hypothetical protein
MKKKTENRELGRPEELQLEDLPDRFRVMKRFVEHNWGRIGLGLKHAQVPDDVRSTLMLVPDIEQLVPFRGHARCLIALESVEVDDNELRATRRKYRDSCRREDRLWSEYHEANKNAREVTDALRAAISQFEQTLGYFYFFGVLFLLGQELQVRELTKKAMTSEKTVHEVQAEKQSLEKLLCAQETSFSRQQMVEFAKNRRHRKTALNFTRVMAGLPEWGWFHARRTCEDTIKDNSPPASPYQLFELVRELSRKMKPLSMRKLEEKLREKLLDPNTDLFLRGYGSFNWHDLQEAIPHGKGFKRSEVPYKIVERFLQNIERPKTIAEAELAKRNQLPLKGA